MKDFNAGRYVTQGSYKSFQPNPINRNWEINDMEVMSLLSKADRMLGRLDMYSEHIPNIDLFISMHMLKEATQSTKIEGTQTNMQEALLNKEDVPLDKRNDWAEVQNYIKAMNDAITKMDELPFSSRLIRYVHNVLMQGVRGEHKMPGEFRRSQNWIGGTSISDAIFIPPVFSSIPDLMEDIEKFVHNDNIYIPDLLKIALIHYQFETIHPFLDGNGRTGRLLITLYLVSKNILKCPVLYLSDFLESHRNSYYNLIMGVRLENKIEDWFKFFLKGIIETSEKSVDTFSKILELEKEYENIVKKMGNRSANALKLITSLYKRPIINASLASEVTGLSPASTYTLISELEKNGVLSEITGNKRGKCYIMEKYFNLFNNK